MQHNQNAFGQFVEYRQQSSATHATKHGP